MRSSNTPVFREIVLAGGGHTHALLIRKWGMTPMPGVRLTLVSPDPLTPYSGMLPGLIAGHYTFDDIHIDLVRLCHWANVRFICASVTGIDTTQQTVHLTDRPDLEFDVLSVDTGSMPDTSIPGAAEFVVPIKPIAGFWQRWQALLDTLRNATEPKRIAVVGGGAGSVEAVLAMAWQCRNVAGLTAVPEFHLLFQTGTILPGYPVKVQKAAQQACADLNISLHAGFRVTRIDADSVHSEQGSPLATDFVLLCTQAAAPQWPALAGLDCDEHGFITVNSYLQSASHPQIFAAGDIAHMINNPRPKAGVYAVRQAPCLFANLGHALLDEPLEAYKPQDRFLSLLALGGKVATGNRGWISVHGDWAWRWKNRIDSEFMNRFSVLPDLSEMADNTNIPPAFIRDADPAEKLDPAARCGGCGGKIGASVLSDVIREITGSWQPEDASAVAWPTAELLQSIDALKAPFDDPWLMGRISVFHALNDLLAMNASPHSMLVSLTLPFASGTIQRRELARLIHGILSACREEGVALLGGHSSEANELSVCIAANGVPGENTFHKTGAKAGDLLVTNKPLGTGIILAGLMAGKTAGRDLATTLASMNRSNRADLAVLQECDVHCCTDISGFGLLGHLTEMLSGGESAPTLILDSIPVLDGVKALLDAGIRPSLLPQNAELALASKWTRDYQNNWQWPLLLDPQTSGGLLAAVPEADSDALEEAGFHIIGRLHDR